MAKILCCLSFSFLQAISLYAQQDNNLLVDTKIDEITVYLNGAEVRSFKSLNIKKGENKIIFSGLSPYLQDNSVQVAVDNTNIDIASISEQLVYLPSENIDTGVKSLHDTVNILGDKIELLKNQIDALTEEKEMLNENRYIGGSQTGISTIELSKAADFFHDRVLKINYSLSALKKRMSALTMLLDSVNHDLKNRISKINASRKQIIVVVSSKIDQKVTFNIRYLVSNASWQATYDIIAEDISKPVTLKYKAQVYNGTAIHWDNVKVTLSTADPSLSATRPYLTAWTLNYASQENEGQGILQNKLARASQVTSTDSTPDFDNIAVAELSTSFAIPKPYSIASDSDSQPYSLELSTDLLQTTYEYLTIPKVDMSAFLLAKVTGWEKLNLIDGMANIYFGNMYVGQSKIDTRLITDTLELSLGRDNQILVSRAKLEDISANGFIGVKRTESFIYEINIKNNRKSPITIKIQDQVPISQESDILVEIDDISGANHDNLSGRLQWLRKIGSSENVKYRVAFSVKYPKNKNVSIRKQRLVTTPRYRH